MPLASQPSHNQSIGAGSMAFADANSTVDFSRCPKCSKCPTAATPPREVAKSLSFWGLCRSLSSASRSARHSGATREVSASLMRPSLRGCCRRIARPSGGDVGKPRSPERFQCTLLMRSQRAEHGAHATPPVRCPVDNRLWTSTACRKQSRSWMRRRSLSSSRSPRRAASIALVAYDRIRLRS